MTEAEPWKGAADWLVHPWLKQWPSKSAPDWLGASVLLDYVTQDHIEGDGTAYNGLDPLPPGVSQDCPSQTCPTFQYDGGIFKTEVPVFQLILLWVKLKNYYFFTNDLFVWVWLCTHTCTHLWNSLSVCIVSKYLSCPWCNSWRARPGGLSVNPVI